MSEPKQPAPGPRDHLITERLLSELGTIDATYVETAPLDAVEAPERLARHLMGELRRALDPERTASEQVEQVNALLRCIDRSPSDAAVAVPPRVLQGVRGRSALGQPLPLPVPPRTPFAQSDLLVNGEGQPNIGSELRAELASADRVDLICAFVIWSGVRHLRDALEGVVARGGTVRVITTTYMGATEKKAVDALHDLGAQVQIAFDARTTKLHAKAWLLERGSGLTTSFVGSSNLSHTALFDGLEWNVRLSSVDAHHVVERVRMTFESHWASEHFEAYDPARNGDALEEALATHGRRSLGESSTISMANLEVRPYPHQQRMLEALTIERQRHERHRNLVVAATGTGKTVVAAFDYRQLCEQAGGRRLRLLFVAHREQILEQSLATYRAVLHDGSFGQIHGGGRVATGTHVFAMVQSLHGTRLEEIDPGAFDVLVVDEFHHASATTYDRLLRRLRPQELLGLTATPERLDGRDVTLWFDERIAVELRLWEAIDQGFLVPFQYFGVADGTDLTTLPWRRGGYAPRSSATCSPQTTRGSPSCCRRSAGLLFDPSRMRALGFCVSKEHAHFMARAFTEAGLPSVALTGDDGADVRREALSRLRQGDLRCVFSVEILGEGVDVPDVDCLLLLRPTDSATLFAQQLGRGLRRSEGKNHLTVIDLIGQHRREFRFENRLNVIIDPRRGSVADQVEADFPFLPAGCTIDLDAQSQELILDNLRAAAKRSRWTTLLDDLAQSKDDRLAAFLGRHNHRVEDVYRGGHSWSELRRTVGLPVQPAHDAAVHAVLQRALGRLTHIDDPDRVALYRSVLEAGAPPRIEEQDERRLRQLTMLAWGLGSKESGASDLSAFYRALWREDATRAELLELLAINDERSQTPWKPSSLGAEVPLTTHAHYSRQEVVAALGSGSGVKPKITQGGILWVPQSRSDVFFVDLHKAERDYSPTTMYRDYALSPDRFHWESQSRQTPQQPTVQRYINHAAQGTHVLLFVRERKTFELGTTPFTFLGPAHYESHEGERPVAFTWRLESRMPEELFEVARSVAVA